jgi:hypothetical protein
MMSRGVSLNRDSVAWMDAFLAQRVMAVLVTAIHVFVTAKQGVDGRHKAGHDVERRRDQ